VGQRVLDLVFRAGALASSVLLRIWITGAPDAAGVWVLHRRGMQVSDRPVGLSGAYAVRVPVGPGLFGELVVPPAPLGVTLFAHGSGSSRLSPRNRLVARELNARGVATLLFDLLTQAEEEIRASVFDVELLAERLIETTDWLLEQPHARGLEPCFFGASTGAAAALWAVAEPGSEVGAVVSRGGRPDLAGPRLTLVSAPTLLIVGGADPQVLDLNRLAQRVLRAPSELVVVPGAGHLFKEPGALERVADLAATWFLRWVSAS
jgi:putative phosphoribosyl transferase